MMCLTRTTITLSLLCLLTPSLNQPGRAQDRGGPRVAKKTFLISGTVGQPGVAMMGLPGNPITGTQGEYSVQVEYGWSGTVIPTKKGFQFDPSVKSYTKVTTDQAHENYTAKAITCTISGTVGLAGVVMKGLPGDPIANESGVYRADVPHGWSGTISPSKPGYVFTPLRREYQSVAAPCENQDYAPQIQTFVLSGNVGVGGAVMNGLPDDPITDERGIYQAKVEYGWSGKVMPRKEGYRFEPASRMYPKITADFRNQDYQAKPQMVYISDWIRAGSEPITGVKVMADPGGQSVLTDLQGRYTIQVPYGWSGRLIFSKEGLFFAPDSKQFTNVTSDIIADEFAPPGKPLTPPSRTPASPRAILPTPAGNVFVIPTTQVMPDKFAETADDLRVMLQIFRDKLSEPRLIRGAFVDFGDFFGDRDRALEAFYLQGSAAVFVLEMDAPFSFAPPQATEEKATQESVDTVWQRARQKLYAPQDPARGPAGLAGETERMDFQQFKEDLVKTFRHAANLRNVEPNESVVLTIIAHDESTGWHGVPVSAGGSYSAGGGAWFEGSSYSASSSSFGPGGGSTYADSRTRSSGSMGGRGGAGRVGPGPAPATSATVLTIQAKKVDIDAFARGGLSFEQFQQRVKSFTY